MCCCIIPTDTLMANLFHELPSGKTVDMAGLDAYLRHLIECIPTYVSSDLSTQTVRHTAETYPALYVLSEGPDGLTISRTDRKPALSRFNAAYPTPMASFIERITRSFVRNMA